MQSDDWNQPSYFSVNNTAIAVDPSGTPYAVYSNVELGNKLSVSKFNGTTWTVVGTPSISVGTATYNSIAIDASGTPYISCSDAGIGGRASVYKFNGSNWVPVGSLSVTPVGANYTSLAFDASGTPYLAYGDFSVLGKLSVMKFNGANWVLVGTAGLSTGAATYISLVIDASGNPWVAYQDAGLSNKMSVMNFNGTTWSFVGTAGFTNPFASYISLKLDNAGTPFVAYVDPSILNKVVVRTFNGSSWVNVGLNGFSTSNATYTSFGIDPLGKLYVAFEEYISPRSRISLMTYNGSAWVLNATFPCYTNGFSLKFVNMALNSAGTPYIIFTESSHATCAVCVKYNGSMLTPVGDMGYSDFQGIANTSAIVADNSGNAYVCYRDTAGSGYKAKVLKYNGTNWTPLGGSPFAGYADFLSMAVDNNGTPYISLVDYMATPQTINVMKYNGTSWVNVGGPLASLGYVDANYLKISPNGTPFVLYRDKTSWHRGYVAKLTAGGWTSLGVVDTCSTLNLFYHSMDVDAADVPYVAYPNKNYDPKVKKHNGTNWVQVGTILPSVGFADEVSISLDPAGVPYVVCGPYSSSPLVSKLNGASWLAIGTATDFPGASGIDTRIVVDNMGVAYVMYSDWGNSYRRGNVKKYLGAGNWATVGNINFSSGHSRYASLAVDNLGGIYSAYGEGYLWTKKYKPNITVTTQPANANTCPNTNVTFIASATGAILNKQWKVNYGTGYINVINGGMYSGATTDTLKITNVTQAMSGYKYKCAYTDVCGIVTSFEAVLNYTSSAMPVTTTGTLLCDGQTTTLTASGVNSYTWSTGSNSPSIAVTPTATINYSVTGTNSLSCQTNSVVFIYVYPTPTVGVVTNDSIICSGISTTLTAYGANTYTWSTGISSTSVVVSPTVTTNYTVSGQYVNGCINTSSFTQSVSACIGINELSESNLGISLYPNPNNGVFTLQMKNEIDNSEIEIENMLGQKLFSQKYKHGNNLITSEFTKGIYNYNILQNKKRLAGGKMVVE